MTRILLIGVQCLLIMAGAAFGQATGKIYSDRVAAVVNGDVILESEVQKFKLPTLRQFMADIPVGIVPPGKWPTEREILDELVVYRLMEQDATHRKVGIDDRQVDASIEQMRQRNKATKEAFLIYIASIGLSYEEFHELLKRKLKIFQAISLELRDKLAASEQDYQEYFKKNRDQIDAQWQEMTTGAATPPQPEEQEPQMVVPKEREVFEGGRLKLRQLTLLVPRDAKPQVAMKGIEKTLRQIMDELRTGADFASLVKKYSKDQSEKRSGGDLGWINYKDMRPEMQKVVRSMKVGDPGDPMMSQQGVRILFLERAEGRIARKEPIPEKERKMREKMIAEQRKRYLEEREKAKQAQRAKPRRPDSKPSEDSGDPDAPHPSEDKKAEEIKATGILTPDEAKEYAKAREKVVAIVQQKRIQERLKSYIDQLKKGASIEIKI